jgi:hypothetical protein
LLGFFISLVYERYGGSGEKMKNSMFRDIRIAPPLQASPLDAKTYAANTYLSLNSRCSCLFNADTALMCYPCYRPCLPSYVSTPADYLLPTAKQYYDGMKSYNRKHPDPAQHISLEEVARLLRDLHNSKTVGEVQAIERKLADIQSNIIHEVFPRA